MSKSLNFQKPSRDLQPYIGAYLLIDLPDGDVIEDLVYPGWMHLRLLLDGKWVLQYCDVTVSSDDTPAVVQGPFSHALRVRTTPPTRAISVSLTPLGVAALTGKSASLFADKILPLEALLDGAADGLHRDLRAAQNHAAMWRTLDGFFAALATEPYPTSPLLQQAQRLIADPEIAEVEAFARGIDRSPRQAARISLDVFGFLPKLLLRRQRFLRTLVILRENPDKPWAELIGGDYYDHSHFLRDFRRFMGMTPTEYFARPRPLTDAVMDQRRELYGYPHQTLEPVAPREH